MLLFSLSPGKQTLSNRKLLTQALAFIPETLYCLKSNLAAKYKLRAITYGIEDYIEPDELLLIVSNIAR